MLHGARTTPDKRYANCIYNDLISNDWGRSEIFSITIMGVLHKIMEKHCPRDRKMKQ